MQLGKDRGKNPPDMESHAYLAGDVTHSGDAPSPVYLPHFEISMARHHVVAWNILRAGWNAADRNGHGFVCAAIYKVMTGRDAIPDSAAEDTVRNEVCWSRGNLILGPDGTIRLFDPGEKLDFEMPTSMTGAARERVNFLFWFGTLLERYAKFKKNELKSIGTWRTEFEVVVSRICLNTADIYPFDRSAWSLFRKAEIVWAPSPVSTGNKEVREKRQGLWHRAGYSADSVAKIFPDTSPIKVGLQNRKGHEKDLLLDSLKKTYELSVQREVLESVRGTILGNHLSADLF
jgi:hypothetical protein